MDDESGKCGFWVLETFCYNVGKKFEFLHVKNLLLCFVKIITINYSVEP